MNISTERLTRSDLPFLERWLCREDGAVTPNDLPSDPGLLSRWFEDASSDSDRLDCLALVYETPVGMTGLHRRNVPEGYAALYLLLGETAYNPLRTATYVIFRMLDRAFTDLDFDSVGMDVLPPYGWLADILARMGFSRAAVRDGVLSFTVEKDAFARHRHLF